MLPINAIIRYAPHFISLTLKQIPYYFYKKNHTEKECWDYAYKVLKDHCKAILKCLKVDLKVTGQENIPQDENIVYILNHQSILDVVALLPHTKTTTLFIAKNQIKKWPVFGKWFVRMAGIFLDREDPREGLKVINEASRRVSECKIDATIFPEGTRFKNKTMGEFHKGSIKLAQKAGVRVQPCALNGGYKILEEGRIGEGHVMYLHFLEPIDVNNISREEGKVIHETIRQKIFVEVERLKSYSEYN